MTVDVAHAIKAAQDRLAELDRERDTLLAQLQEWRSLLGIDNPRRNRSKGKKRRAIRENSTLGSAMTILQHHGRPMLVDALKVAIENLTGIAVARSTLVSSLSRYVRSGDTFTRPSPGMYGLVEFEEVTGK